MNKRIGKILPLSLLVGALIGCASTTPEAQLTSETPQEGVVDSSLVVNYACGDAGAEPLQVEYGFVGQVVVVAIVGYAGEVSPVLQRVPDDRGANVFYGQGVVWMTDSADLSNMATASGRALLQQAEEEDGNGAQPTYDQLIQDCRVVPAL